MGPNQVWEGEKCNEENNPLIALMAQGKLFVEMFAKFFQKAQ